MKPLDNLLIYGVSNNFEFDPGVDEEGTIRYSINQWESNKPKNPSIIPIPYRGSRFSTFNDLITQKDILLVGDGTGILSFKTADISSGYLALAAVREVSDYLQSTTNYLASCWHHVIQLRASKDIAQYLKDIDNHKGVVDIPFKQFQHGDEGDTILSMPVFGKGDNEKILLNNASDESYIFDLKSFEFEPLNILTGQTFDSSFQRRHKYHFLPQDDLKYSIFTESTNDKLVPNRVYELSIHNSPELREVDPLVLENKKILSMLPTKENKLQFLTNYKSKSFIEMLNPYNKEIVDSRPLSGRYELGDRLQKVDNHLLIVRHLHNEIVDAETEDSIILEGADVNVAIPEISSTWEMPQYMYVASSNII